MAKSTSKPRFRFGIAEWYGRPIEQIPLRERRDLAAMQTLPKESRQAPPCPFLSPSSPESVPCWKEGGVCSLRRYQETGGGAVVADQEGGLRITCPSRFEEGAKIYTWIGEVLFQDAKAVPVGQVSFLRRVPTMGSANDELSASEGVGRIDNVLLVPDSTPLDWCAVEIQAVYFSGARMSVEFEALALAGASLPFPAGHRRPDYRSSGPKRLMPQLQIKVPTLRRWGKKMAVVVDEYFFAAMGRMSQESDLSNCDVAWFVVDFDANHQLQPARVFLTTLEQSVEGLVAAQPVSLQEFEARIRERYLRLPASPA